MSLPNILTGLRILLIPLFISLLIYQHYLSAVLVFCLAAVTDFLDGLAARLTDQNTSIGGFLDPIADKLLAVTSFVTLAILGPIPIWFAVIVISRDVIISIGTLILYISIGPVDISPKRLGKVTTFLQFFTILITLIVLITGSGWIYWRTTLFLTVFFTVLSGLQYLRRGLSYMGENGKEEINQGQ